VKRKCEHIITARNEKRAIYIDSTNKNEILEYIYQDKRHKKKFLYITDILLSGLKNSNLYDKEDINEKCKDVTAMKFFKGQENDRLYCKEIHNCSGKLIIVISILHKRKKDKTLSAKEISIIEKVGGYEYEV